MTVRLHHLEIILFDGSCDEPFEKLINCYFPLRPIDKPPGNVIIINAVRVLQEITENPERYKR